MMMPLPWTHDSPAGHEASKMRWHALVGDAFAGAAWSALGYYRGLTHEALLKEIL